MRPLLRTLYGVHVTSRETLSWTRRALWDEPLFRGQCEAIGPRFRLERLPYLTGRGRIVIGSDVRLSGKSEIGFNNHFEEHFGDVPEVVIGDHTFVGHGCRFAAARSIRVGRHCLLAGGVAIFDLDGHPLDAAARRAGGPPPATSVRPVLIGDDVWIGRGAIILRGVRIGDRSVVGAGAVVTRCVPADVVVAGNPARIVKRLVELPSSRPERDL